MNRRLNGWCANRGGISLTIAAIGLLTLSSGWASAGTDTGLTPDQAARQAGTPISQAATPSVATGPLSERWRFDTRDAWAGFNTPVVSHGLVVAASDGLFAIDAVSGREVWSLGVGDGFLSEPTVADDTVYVGSWSGNLTAINVTNGELRWSVPLGSEVRAPTVADGTVFVGTKAGLVVALDAATGAQRWSYQLLGEIQSAPAVSNDTVYLGDYAGTVVALDIATGEERWTFPVDGEVGASPVVGDGVVYIGTWNSYLYALETARGRPKWRVVTDGDPRQRVALHEQAVYVGTDAGTLTAYAAPDGAVIWTLAASGFFGDPAIVDGTIYVPADGILYAIDAVTKDSQEVWTCGSETVIYAGPTVADDVVYIACNDGAVYALD